jgi:excinuclease ABC subunit A
MYSEHLACLYDDLSFEELEPRSFSFNSPVGRVPGLHRPRATGWRWTRSWWSPTRTGPWPGARSGPWSGGHVSDYFIR